MVSAPHSPTTSPQPEALRRELLAISLSDLLGATGSPEEQVQLEDEFEDRVFQEVVEFALLDQLTDQDVEDITTLLEAQYDSDEALHTAVLGKLRQLIPNLEAKLQDFAIEAKTELFEARLDGLREHYAQQSEPLKRVEAAAASYQAGQLTQAVEQLKTL